MDPLNPGDPQRVGDYVLRGRLGAGGMGEVFFGHSPGGRPVAVKLIYPVFANDSDFRRRFRHEVDACRKVGGFHTAQVVDAQPDADRPWLVTAYVAGPSLAQVLAEYGALPLRSVKVLGAGLAEALEAIHGAGLIHRDLKPSNILLADDGPRVIDFGIARAIDASGITARPGTPGFMAPEVLTGLPLVPACDVFALGMVLAFASGVRPFGEGPSEAITYRIVHQPPNLDDLDPSIRDIVAACMSKEPSDRPSPSQVLHRLASPGDAAATWLPESVRTMIPPRDTQYQPTAVVHVDRSRAGRLLDEAERLARAIFDPALRARALVHAATVVAHTDPAHADRLVDDALHPPRNSGFAMPHAEQIMEGLVRSSALELGMVAARIGAEAAGRLLADIEHVTQTGLLDGPTSGGRVALARAMAVADVGCAERIASGTPDGDSRAQALAAVSEAVARSDIARAEQIADTITEQDQQQGMQNRIEWTWLLGKGRKRDPSAPRWSAPRPDLASCLQAYALAHIAVTLSSTMPVQERLSADAAQFARTVTAAGGWVATHPIRPDDAMRLLEKAEHVARSIPAEGDWRARALAEVKSAEVKIWPDRGTRLLAEAEQIARTITNDDERMLALSSIAMVAARTDPARAEQISRSLHYTKKLGQIALTMAHADPSRAELIASAIGDDYLQALVPAVVAVRVDPSNAKKAIEKALAASRGSPTNVIEVAVIATVIDPDWAEKIARTAGDHVQGTYSGRYSAAVVRQPSTGSRRQQLRGSMRQPHQQYWDVRALADLANVYRDSTQNQI